MSRAWSFETAGRVVFGAGSLARVGEIVERLGAKRAALVSDPNFAGSFDRIRDACRRRGVELEVWSGGEPEPAVAVVERAAEDLAGCRFDALLALGGGSNIDVAKAVAVLRSHGGAIGDYEGQNQVPGPVVPIVAIPSTAGSGSEVSAACILSVPEDDSKLAVVDPHIRPAVALVDPEVHSTCPPSVTRDAGIDAFCHAVEAFTIADCDAFPRDPADPWPLYQGRHPMSDALAERAIGLIATSLPRALEAPRDLEARGRMAVGAVLAGMAMANTGIYTVHALTYPVGAFTHASHGACNGVLLPAVLDFVEPVRRAESRRILDLMGSPRERVGDAVRDWLRALGAPTTLRELGMRPDQLERTAEIGHGIRRLMNGSPRPTSPEELLSIVRAAYGSP